MVPESAGRAAGPLVKVTLCEVGLSFQVQVTLLPFFTTTLEGLNEMFCRLTAPEVGGAAAGAETVWGVADPMLSVALATPFAPVVLCAGLTPPPPDATVQFTTTPGTAQLLASNALTLSPVGSGLLKYHACVSPPFFTSWVAAPGVQGPVPPPLLPPPHAARRDATASAARRAARLIASPLARGSLRRDDRQCERSRTHVRCASARGANRVSYPREPQVPLPRPRRARP